MSVILAGTSNGCMICDLYKIIQLQLADQGPGREIIADFVDDLVTVLPPRGHAFHNLGILEDHYKTPPLLLDDCPDWTPE